MSDVVSSAITNSAVNFQTTANTRWTITFTNNEVRKGQLTSLGGGSYLLQGQRPHYFSAAQVVYMTMSGDQS